MKMPAKIIDLHTHLFNARYIPLASAIANAMGKDESELANYVAKLLESITGSSYPDSEPIEGLQFLSPDAQDEYRLEKIWSITEHELLQTVASFDGSQKSLKGIRDASVDDTEFTGINNSSLIAIITVLSEIDYAEEGWKGFFPEQYSSVVSRAELDESLRIGDLFDWGRGVVKKAFWVVVKLMDPETWGAAENYLEFFLTMLKSEAQMVNKVFKSYGDGLPQLQIVHYLMDMQMAFEGQKPPMYQFYPIQLDKMQKLQQSNKRRVYGFSAFDPRRPEWRKHAEESLAKGFLGFKFYPAMGYKPFGNDQDIQDIINAFFDFCIERDSPIFVHCTPQGFQTRKKLGRYAHPKHWCEVLNQRNNLRLCFGHAGGGNMKNGDLKSSGWMATSEIEWIDADNFARIVSEFCLTYPNVYCEIGYITDLFEDAKLEIFVNNIERARNFKPKKFDLLDKMAYGSDWHMPDMVDNTRKYIDVFLKIMNRPVYKNYIDNFFWKNAHDFLRLPS